MYSQALVYSHPQTQTHVGLLNYPYELEHLWCALFLVFADASSRENEL